MLPARELKEKTLYTGKGAGNTPSSGTGQKTVSKETSEFRYHRWKWSESHSVVSDSLWPHGLYSPWNSPGQNTGVGSLFLLQGIFPTQGSNPGVPRCRQILYQLSHKDQSFAIIGRRDQNAEKVPPWRPRTHKLSRIEAGWENREVLPLSLGTE